MKVNIWIHKNDVKNLGDMDVPISYIKKYYLTRPYQDRHDEWVQVTISVDDFVQLEDNKYSNKATFEGSEYETIVNPAVNGVPNVDSLYNVDDGVCEGEYVRAALNLQGTKWNDFIDSLKDEQKVKLSRCWD